MTPDILLVEDTASLALVYESVLARAGYAVDSAGTAAEALSRFEAARPRVVLLDLMLPDGDGLELLRACRRLDGAAQFVVITANGSINRAVEAMRAGAFEFLVKPLDEQRLVAAVAAALQQSGAPPPGAAAAAAAAPPAGFIGSSPEMRDVYSRIRSVARSMATVFVSGESGTGKEVCALAIHRQSRRARGPFVPLNCGAIPADLLESEVFGHLKGSFTGAIADKPGAAQAADGGTLFLDEICEMDLALQTKLLRFLQTSTVQPVGAPVPRKIDVRIICATNRDPLEQVRQGRFREDLYYRLHVVPIHLPPLRARGDDVLEIAGRMLAELSHEEGKAFERLAPEVRMRFRAYPWPGNIRQLLNVLRNIVVLHDGPEVTAAMLPDEIAAAEAGAPDPGPAAVSDGLAPLIGRPLAEIERLVIEATIAEAGGSVPRAARVLGVSPSTLYRKRDGWRRSG